MKHEAGYLYNPVPPEYPSLEDVSRDDFDMLVKIHDCKKAIFTAILNRLDDGGFSQEKVARLLPGSKAAAFESRILGELDALDDLFDDLETEARNQLKWAAEEKRLNVTNELDQLLEEYKEETKAAYRVRRGV